MLVPLSWLADWIELPDSVEALAESLTGGGLEVDAIERTGPDLSALVVGDVVEHGPHPNADRLSVCRVDAGDDEPFEVVCGAPNVAAGQKIAFARVGTRLPDGTRLKKSRIRSVTSMGMICSERELGLGDEHEGILVLDTDAPAGTPLADVLSAGETILEIAITANRGDCASILGIAREVRAHFGAAVRVPTCDPPEGERAVAEDLRVEITDPEGCHRYDARVVRGVRVGPSPNWMQQRLEAAGMRPINVVVDVTNYVMLELGQPLHAFDLDRLRGGVIRVRSAEAGERMTTLDGVERTLDPSDLLITDGGGPVAVAGVIGGGDSEVSDATTNLLIESAHFRPGRVRLTAKRLGVQTDASYRFERGVDRAGVTRAADRAARLIAELAGGEVSRGVATATGSTPDGVDEIALAPARVNGLLGTALSRDEIEAYLARVGVEPATESESESGGGGRHGDEPGRYAIPSHRNDLRIAEDLIEEVARIHGLDRIPATVQVGPLVGGGAPRSWTDAERARDTLWAEGVTEVMCFPFLDPRDLDRLDLAESDPRRATLGVVNPIAESHSQLRSTLLPSLLGLLRENRNRQIDRVRIFEVSRVFRVEKEGELPEEDLCVAAVLTRSDQNRLWEAKTEAAPPLFFEAKGIALRLVSALGYRAELRPGAPQPYQHPGASAGIRVGRRVVGEVGELHPDAAARFAIDVPCAVIELSLSALADVPRQEKRFREVSRHPQMQRDLAVLVDRDQRAGELVDAIRRKGGDHLASVEVFDRYEGQGVPEGKVSLAFRLVFQRVDRTLTDGEVTKSVDQVVKMLANQFGGELR
ncbi:MAG: phenylalanine--tRNA ligase subunit beta [Proteobacteria bacterium]|nr:phenylalanine--tRNA ligase subunit beta [Pseudomonadota bacterium]